MARKKIRPKKTKFKTNAAERTSLLEEAMLVAQTAGHILLYHYDLAERNVDILQTEIKDDNSPVTNADKAAHDFITLALRTLTPDYPIISEENKTQPTLKKGVPYWVVDPLDGTKEFIGRTGGFCVKIALIDNDTPVIGIVNCPVPDVIYYSSLNKPAHRKDGNAEPRKIRADSVPTAEKKKGGLTVLFNKAHVDQEALQTGMEKLLERGLDLNRLALDGEPGLPRNLRVAEGLADIFADCGGNPALKEGCGFIWDYAADYLILKNAGAVMRELLTGKEPNFKDPLKRHNAYAAIGHKSLWKKLFP